MHYDIKQLKHDVYAYQQSNILKLPDAIEKFNHVTAHVEYRMNKLTALEELHSQFAAKEHEVFDLTKQVSQLQLELENMRSILGQNEALMKKLYPEEKRLRVYQNQTQRVNDYKLVLRLLSVKPGESAVIKVNNQRFTLELGEVETLVVNQHKNRKKSCYMAVLEPDLDAKRGKAYADVQFRCGVLI